MQHAAVTMNDIFRWPVRSLSLIHSLRPPNGLPTVEARLDGKVLRSNGGPYVRRVLAAAVDANGRPTAVATTPYGALAVTAAGDSVPAGAADVSVANLCLNPRGKLKCLCARAGTREIRAFEQLYGRWTETKSIGTPGAVSAVACAGCRGRASDRGGRESGRRSSAARPVPPG